MKSRFARIRGSLAIVVATVITLTLASCGSDNWSSLQTEQRPPRREFSKREPLRAPLPPMPPPEYVAEFRTRNGKDILTSRVGLYFVYLSKVESGIMVELRRAPTFDIPGFESTASTEQGRFQQRLLSDLIKHPQFATPLKAVLEKALDSETRDLPFTQENRETLTALRESLSRLSSGAEPNDRTSYFQ